MLYLPPKQIKFKIIAMNEILDALKIKFEGFSVKQLEVKANSMAKNGKSVNDVGSLTAESVTEAYADYRTNVALKANNAQGGQSDKGGNPKTETNSNPATGGNGANDTPTLEVVPAWAQELISTNKTLTDKVNGFELSKVSETRQSQLSKVIASLPDDIRASYDDVDLMKMDDTKFSEYVQTVNTRVGNINADIKSSGATFSVKASSVSEVSKEATDAEMDELFK